MKQKNSINSVLYIHYICTIACRYNTEHTQLSAPGEHYTSLTKHWMSSIIARLYFNCYNANYHLPNYFSVSQLPDTFAMLAGQTLLNFLIPLSYTIYISGKKSGAHLHLLRHFPPQPIRKLPIGYRKYCLELLTEQFYRCLLTGKIGTKKIHCLLNYYSFLQ